MDPEFEEVKRLVDCRAGIDRDRYLNLIEGDQERCRLKALSLYEKKAIDIKTFELIFSVV